MFPLSLLFVKAGSCITWCLASLSKPAPNAINANKGPSASSVAMSLKLSPSLLQAQGADCGVMTPVLSAVGHPTLQASDQLAAVSG